MAIKQYIATIGYERYLVRTEDLMALIRIASRARRLEHVDDKYNSPFHVAEDQEPFVIVEIAEVCSDEVHHVVDLGLASTAKLEADEASDEHENPL